MNSPTTLLTAWADAERTGDAATTARLLTDDFVGIGPIGYQLPKHAWLQRLSDGDLHYDQLALDEISARTYGDCAVITARWNARGTARGHPIPEATRATLVAVKSDGTWQLASIHFSFLGGPPGTPAAPGPS